MLVRLLEDAISEDVNKSRSNISDTGQEHSAEASLVNISFNQLFRKFSPNEKQNSAFQIA